MRVSTKLLGALAAATIVAAGGSAFTAASTIDNNAKHVGAVAQTISGVTVTNVQYTINPATDATTQVAFHVAEDLKSSDVVTATVSGTTGTGGPTEATVCAQTPVGSGLGTTLTCTYTTGVTNVTGFNIVAS